MSAKKSRSQKNKFTNRGKYKIRTNKTKRSKSLDRFQSAIWNNYQQDNRRTIK